VRFWRVKKMESDLESLLHFFSNFMIKSHVMGESLGDDITSFKRYN